MADASSPLNQFQLWRAMLPPALRVLLTLNVVTYVAFVLLSIFGVGDLVAYLALPGTLGGLAMRPWSVLTWGVANLYPGFFGLISFAFGVTWLNMLGRDVEQEGRPETLIGLYVFGVLGGTALALAAGALVGGAAGGGALGSGLYFGVWGPLLAVLCYVAVLHPDRPIGLFLLGAVAMKWVAIGVVVLELAFSKDPSHLGAALAGTVFAFAEKRGVSLGRWAGVFFRDRTPSAPTSRRTVGRAVAVARTDGRAPQASAAVPSRPTVSDVDAVLDKIIEKGMDSLTDEERRILNEGSTRGRRG